MRMSDPPPTHPLSPSSSAQNRSPERSQTRTQKLKLNRSCEDHSPQASAFYKWSDEEEWKQFRTCSHSRPSYHTDLNSILVWLELFILILTLISPLFMIIIPSLWNSRSQISENSRAYNQDVSCKSLCEVGLISLCTKLLVLFVLIFTIYRIRLHSLSLCARKILYSYSKLLRTSSARIRLSLERSAYELLDTDKGNFPVYFINDFLMISVTFIFWIYFIWSWANGESLSSLAGNGETQLRPFGQSNPLVTAPTSTIHSARTAHGKQFHVTLKIVSKFVDMHLLIQIFGALLFKLWQNASHRVRYVVHVCRAPDGLSRSYNLGRIDIHSAAYQIVQYVSLEPRIYDPLRTKTRRRFSRCRSCGAEPLHSTLTCTKALPHVESPPHVLSDISAPISRRKSRVPRAQTEDLFKIYTFETPVSGNTKGPLSHSSANSGTGEDIATRVWCLKAINQRQLNAAAAERNHLQNEYEQLLRKRQVRLTLLATQLFRSAETKMPSTVEDGYKSDRTWQLRQASQSIFEQIYDPLCKYLRFSGQQHLFQPQSIRERITLYLICKMSAEAFLSPYFQSKPKLVRNPQERTLTQEIQRSSTVPTVASGTAVYSRCFSCKPRCASAPEKAQGDNTNDSEKRRFICCSKPKNNYYSYQTWRLRLHNSSSSSLIFHGLRFELLRADVTLMCTVYRLPVLQLSPTQAIPLWSTSLPRNVSMPASTVDTYVESSENFMEIRI